MLEIVSLHLKLSDLVTRAITILQDYDCETLGEQLCHQEGIRVS